MKLHFLLHNCARQDGQRFPTCGASFFSCAASSLDEPQSYSTFFFLLSFKSLSLLPQQHTHIPPVSSHQSGVLIHLGKAQPHVQHRFSCCPTVATTHLPHQHPCSSPGLHALKVMPKAVGWPIKTAWSRHEKKDINFFFHFSLGCGAFSTRSLRRFSRPEINPSRKNVGGPVYFINHKCLYPATNTWEVPGPDITNLLTTPS